MEKMKRAVFFSVASILIVVLFAAMTSMVSDINVRSSELDLARAKITMYNSVIEDFENNYFDKVVYVAAKNALIGLSEKRDEVSSLHRTPEFVLNNTIDDGIIYGSGGNEQLNLVDTEFSQTHTMDVLKQEFIDELGKIGFTVYKFEVIITSVTQSEPFYMTVRADIDYYLSDAENTVSWRGISQREVEIDVYGLEYFGGDRVGRDWCEEQSNINLCRYIFSDNSCGSGNGVKGSDCP